MERDTRTATLLRDDERAVEGDAPDTVNVSAADDFFSDAPLDAAHAVTGKTCNIWDPECEACQ